MSVSSEVTKHVYSGNGAVVSWPYTFDLPDDADVGVFLTDPAGTVEELSEGFTVDAENSRVLYPSGAGDPLPSGWKITLLRKMPMTQETAFVNQGPFFAETVEDALDRLTYQVQQLKETTSRSIRWPVHTEPAESELDPTPILDARTEAVAAAGTAVQAMNDSVTAQGLAEAALAETISTKNSALVDIGTARSGALTAISSARSAALGEMSTLKAQTVREVGTLKSEAQTAARQSQDYKNQSLYHAGDAADAAYAAEQWAMEAIGQGFTPRPDGDWGWVDGGIVGSSEAEDFIDAGTVFA